MHSNIIIFIGVVQTILFLTHFAIYKAVLFFGDIQGKSALILRISFIVLSVFFFVGSIITAKGYSVAGRTIYTVAAVWLGTLVWLFGFTVIGVILWNIGTMIFPILSSTILYRQIFGGILLAIVIGINIYGLINAQYIRTTRYDVEIPNLPPAWFGKKAVLVADTHYGNIWNVTAARQLVEKISELKPDVILISGDYFDGPKINFAEVAEEYRELASSTPYGIFYVTGNHEEYRGKDMYLEPLRDINFKILDSDSVLVNGLRIAGISYADGTTKEKQDLAMKKIHAEINADKNDALGDAIDSATDDIANGKNRVSKDSTESSENIENRASKASRAKIIADGEKLATEIITAPIILLKHVPLLLDSALEHGVYLQVSGHTHRGQIWPFSIITNRMYKGFDYGLKTYKSTNLHSDLITTSSMQVLTTSGAGSWGPPQRIGTFSEIVEITFK